MSDTRTCQFDSQTSNYVIGFVHVLLQIPYDPNLPDAN